jgi:hypothetical protein
VQIKNVEPGTVSGSDIFTRLSIYRRTRQDTASRIMACPPTGLPATVVQGCGLNLQAKIGEPTSPLVAESPSLRAFVLPLLGDAFRVTNPRGRMASHSERSIRDERIRVPLGRRAAS